MGFGMKGGLDEGDGSRADGTYAEEKWSEPRIVESVLSS